MSELKQKLDEIKIKTANDKDYGVADQFRFEILLEIIGVMMKTCDDIDFCRTKDAPEDIENIADRFRWVAREALTKAATLAQKI